MNKKNKINYHSLIQILIFACLSLIFIYTPYEYGLFFDQHFYKWQILINVLAVLVFIYMVSTRNKFNIISYLLYVIPILFFISFFNAESPFAALEEILRWTTYASFFFLLYFSSQSKVIKTLMPYIFYITITWITLFGFLALWDKVDFTNAMLSKRMSSIFQYPNTFGTVAVMGWLFGMVMLLKKDIKIWETFLYSLPLVLFSSALFLSVSQGALVVFPIAWLIGLILLNPLQQLKYIIITGLTTLSGAYVYKVVGDKLDTAMIGQDELLITSLTVLVIMLLLNHIKLLNKYQLESKRWLKWGIVGTIIASSLALVLDLLQKGLIYSKLPINIQKSISSINFEDTNVLGRFQFYKDALTMSKDSPILGFGGDGWRILFTKYQEVPYTSREIHNFYLELILNIGWVGTAIAFVVFGYLFFKILQNINLTKDLNVKVRLIAVIPATVMLLLHAFIDFDFSYGTTVFILLWLIVMGLPKISTTQTLNRKVNLTVQGLLIIASILAVWFSMQLYSANKEVTNTTGDLSLEAAEELYLSAKDSNPYNVEYYLKLANIYQKAFEKKGNANFKERALQLIEQAEKLEPNNPTLLYKIGQFYTKLNQKKESISYYKNALSQDRFNKNYLFAYIVDSVLFSEQLLLNGQIEKSKSLLENAINKYEQNNIYMEELPKRHSLYLHLDSRAHLLIGEAYYLLDEHSSALDSLTKVSYNKGTQEFLRQNALLHLIYTETGQEEKLKEITAKVKDVEQEFNNYLSFFKKIKQ